TSALRNVNLDETNGRDRLLKRNEALLTTDAHNLLESIGTSAHYNLPTPTLKTTAVSIPAALEPNFLLVVTVTRSSPYSTFTLNKSRL
ncbi:hypothetical protein CU098_003577, partial [Rhizopus stolonifer]